MRRCALFLLIALALALLAVGAQAQERGDAAGEPPAAPRMTRLSWSGLTIRAEWDSVARATGYDLRWTLDGQQLVVGAEREVDSSPAEFSVSRAGRWRVEVRARIGSGPSAARGEWSRPLTMRLYDAPPRLEVERFDGEYARLNWTGVGAHYELEWGERGKAKRLVRRDGRSPTLELGPLEGGKTYEFRVRARNNGGRSGYSPTAVFTPTGWRGGRPGAAYVGRIGQIYALWFPQRGAEWYELSWINAADPTETARVRVGTATSGGSRPQVPGQIGREGGFENGTWNVRVRAGPRGVWSPSYPLTLSNLPARLALELESSRELCTAGTLTEVSWKISGGSAPYALSVENSAVDVSADNARINCGALSEAEAADEDAALAAKRVTAVVTDARGVRREAALDVARARALPPPHLRAPVVQRTLVSTSWVAGSGWWLMRWRAATDSNWTYKLIGSTGQLEIVIGAFNGLAEGSPYVFAVASLRDPIEQSTLDALIWSGNLEATTATTPTGVRTTSTHDTITVSWDDQPSVSYVYVDLIRADEAGRSRRVTMRRRDAVVTNQVTHIDLEPETEYKIHVSVHGDGEAQLHTTIRATTVAAPTAWQPPARGAQSLSVTATHDTITATWDAPTPNTRDRWIVYVEHSSWRRPYSRWVSAPLTFTLEGLTPATTYTVTVAHLDLYGVEVSTTVTTTPAPVQGQSSPSVGGPLDLPLSPEVPTYSWPYRFSSSLQMTTDVWVWRSTSRKFHAGLDVGDVDAAEGEPILAAEAGILRTYRLNAGWYVVYCPTSATNFDEQFHLSRDPNLFTDSDNRPHRCGWVVSKEQGLVALVFHGETVDGRYHLTKYAHLKELSPAVTARLELSKSLPDFADVDSPDAANGATSTSVVRGELIGREGTTGDEGELWSYDPHLHFEMRWFDGSPPTDNWYTSSSISECAQDTGEESYCGWTAKREMETVLDPEVHLAPPPASRTPTSPESKDGDGVDQTRRAFSLGSARVDTAQQGSSPQLELDLVATVWRPKFYTYGADSDWPRGPDGSPPRVSVQGTEGTRPGVTRYRVVAACAPLASRFATGNPGQHGETPPVTVTVDLALGNECEVEVKSLNETYRITVPFTNSPYGKTEEGAPVRPVTPRAKVTWVAELSVGVNVVRTSRSLVRDALDLYTFTAYPGHTYSFCVYASTASACNDDKTTQLLLFGPSGKVREPAATDKPNQLSWTEPASGSPKTTYTLVVRRHASVEGTVTPYSYKLKYTIPKIRSCALFNLATVTVCIPVEPTPSVSNRTHNTVTISWPSSSGDGSTSFTVKHVTGANCDAEGTETTFTPDSANADGVRGAGNQDLQYTFPNLTPSTSYKLCVRSVRTISPSFVLKSDWASVPATTRAEQLAKPGGTSVTNVGQNSLTLNWSEVADAGGYKVKRTGSSSTWTLPSTSRSHRFTGLSSGTYYTLYVQALPKTGSSKVASAWAPKSRRTNSALPPPTPQPPPPPPPIDCLSSTAEGDFATYGLVRSGCLSVRAAMLLPAVQSENSAVCGILRWEGTDSEGNDRWVRYGLDNGRRIPGSVDFEIMIGDTVFLGPCVPASGGVSGASDLEVPSCPDVVKPETGPAVVDADASSCTTVRGGGALQISRGEYTLNVSLASDRDWFAFAPTSYTGSSAGAFLFLDLSTGGWIALYPPDGSELERHAPADATGLPALLDAIAASASTPATE